MNDKFYPVGTIVILRNAKKKMMITGFCHRSSDGSVYDYCGVSFPEGYKGTKANMLFTHKQIIEVCHIGYTDSEFNMLNQKLRAVDDADKKDQ